MGTFSIWHWVIVLAVVLILFGGGGKLSRLMGDMAKGVKAFKKGLKEELPDEGQDEAPKVLKSESAAEAGETAKKDEPAKG